MGSTEQASPGQFSNLEGLPDLPSPASPQPEPSRVVPPHVFTEAVLGMPLYEWQALVMWDVFRRRATSLKAANGSGKTTKVIAPLALWLAAMFPGSTTVLTSGSFRQVKEQLFPAIHAHRDRFPGWSFSETSFETPKGSRCVGFSTDDPGKFEGWHAWDHASRPLLMVIDEAKTVPDCIFEALDRCTYTYLLLTSSPGARVGKFYRTHSAEAAMWARHTATAFDCPHIEQSRIDHLIALHGAQHPLVRSAIYAEFMSMGESGEIMDVAWVEACQKRGPINPAGERKAFCDFAAGGDENVLAIRTGDTIRIEAAWRDTNTMAAVGEFIRLFRQHGLRAEEIEGDDSGLGHTMIDRFHELGWPIHRTRNNEASNDSTAYYDYASEAWDTVARRMERKEITLPNDPLLTQQLTSRRWKPRSDGRLQLEAKEEMAKRGLSSPDRAEAVIHAAMPKRGMKVHQWTTGPTFGEFLTQTHEEHALAGAFAG